MGDEFRLAQSPIITTATPDACFNQGGTVLEYKPWGRGLLAVTGPAQQAPVAPVNNNYTEGGTLPPAVDQDIQDLGIHDDPWTPPNHDCDDFANDLEEAPTDLGYEATYTEYCIPGMPATWHAVTDIHIDGETFWVEPQTGKPIKLDGNGDGMVGTSTSGTPCDGTSEGGFGIRVWDSLADRVAELGLPD